MDTIELYELLKENWLLEDNWEIFEINTNNNIIYWYNWYICKVSDKAAKLKNESEILKKLEYKWKYPNVIFNWKLWFDKYVLITKAISWKPIDDSWYNLNQEEAQLLINEIVESIKNIHSLNTDKNDFKEYISNRSKDYIDIIEANSLFNLEEIERLYNVLLDNLSCFDNDSWTYNLLHNDLIYNNILILDNSLAWIVDFELSVYGPIYIELFNLYYHRDINILNNIISVESDFNNYLIESLRVNYPQLFEYSPIQLKCYNIFKYLQLLSKIDDSNNDIDFIIKFKEFYWLDN